MYSHFNYKYNKTTVILHPGEYYATGEKYLISTVLGSCVAMVIYDEQAGIGGMNHFMLPGSDKKEDFPVDRKGTLAVYALSFLLEALEEAGTARRRLKAKVFGGGNVLGTRDANGELSNSDIGTSNVRKAFSLLEEARIPVISSDVRGENARKIFLDPKFGYVYLKRLERNLLDSVREVEQSYIEELRRMI